MEVDQERIKSKIRDVPNWPKEGIIFRDITTLLRDFETYNYVMRILFERYRNFNLKYVAGIEARGFIFGATLADRLGVGFIPIRKKDKLPPGVIAEEYELEYGTDTVEIAKGSVQEGDAVLVVDDLIATGGTALAACNILKKCGAHILECTFLVDLPNVGGRKKLEDAGLSVYSMVKYD